MASRDYCSNVAEELEVWSQKLHKLSSEIDRIPSIDKYKLQPHIEELHIIMTELDDRLCDLVNTCPTVEGHGIREVIKHKYSKSDFSKNSNELFDYDFGG